MIRKLLASLSLAALLIAQQGAALSALANDVVKTVDIKTSALSIGAQAQKPLELPGELPKLPFAEFAPGQAVVSILDAAVPPADQPLMGQLNIPLATAVPAPHAAIVAETQAAPTSPHDDIANGLPTQLANLGERLFGIDKALDSLAEASMDVDPERKYYPSPEDWRDESVYFVMLDRFARSAQYKSHGDPKDGVSRHGGNIRGVIEKLDYLKAAKGLTTIMLSPVVTNQPDSYHGYAPIHFLQIDPHLGTMEDYKELVREAHKRGIRVIMDWVTNHAGPVFEYKRGPGEDLKAAAKWKGMDGAPKEIGEWTEALKPVELAKPEHFTRRGVIDTWTDPQQSVYGDFPPNYRHFAGDNPETQDMLVKMVLWWITEADIDGVRLDAVRHFAPGLFPRLVKEIRGRAKILGKDNFLVIPENSTGVDAEIEPFMTTVGGDSAYNYPAYRRENFALHGKAPTAQIEESTHKSIEALGPKASYLMRFIDNPDTYRFLRAGEPLSILKMAMAYLFFAMGIPMVYYGTEQAFRQAIDRLEPEGPMLPADPRNREDMFSGGEFKSKSSEGDKFDTSSETFQWLAKISSLRQKLAPLRRGEQYFRYSDLGSPGISAFSRIYNGEEVLVVMNTGSEPRSAAMWVDSGLSPPGTSLVDELDPSYTVTPYAPSQGGSQVVVSVPPHGVRLLVKK